MFVIQMPNGYYYSDTSHTKIGVEWWNVSDLEHAQIFKTRHNAEKLARELNEDGVYTNGHVVKVHLVAEES